MGPDDGALTGRSKLSQKSPETKEAQEISGSNVPRSFEPFQLKGPKHFWGTLQKLKDVPLQAQNLAREPSKNSRTFFPLNFQDTPEPRQSQTRPLEILQNFSKFARIPRT